MCPGDKSSSQVRGQELCPSHLVRQRGEVQSHELGGAELGGFEAPDDVLKSRRHHEVLLLQAQLLPLEELKHSGDNTAQSAASRRAGYEQHFGREATYVVVGVEDPGDVLRQVSVQHGLDVAADINCGTQEAVDPCCDTNDDNNSA